MKKSKGILLTAVWLLLAGTAGFLLRLQQNHKLGPAGLKMVQQSVYDEKGNVIGTNTIDLPAKVLNYESTNLPVTTVELGWLPKDTTYGRKVYQAPDNFGLMLSVVLMGTDRTSIHKPEICLWGQGWTVNKSELLTIPMSRPEPYELPIMKLTATKQVKLPSGQSVNYQSIYAYWFVAENRLTALHSERMWSMAKELIRTGTLQRWAYVAVLAHCPPGQEEATFDRMKKFIVASVPEFQLVPRASSRRGIASSSH